MSIVPPALGSIVDAIGATPAVWLDRLSAGLPGRVLLKLESMNPGGSIKDRAALQCLRDAERDGRLRPGTVVVELTSGNMGIGLAVACAIMGYRMIAVMSEGNSPERRQLLAAYGAEIELVPQAPGGTPGQVSGEDLALVEQRTAELVDELGAWRPDQFANPSNPRAHELGTGPELWEQSGGRLRRVRGHRRHRWHIHRHRASAQSARQRDPLPGGGTRGRTGAGRAGRSPTPRTSCRERATP